MFESAGWEQTAPLVGPVPLAPLPSWTVVEVLAWADRAPFTGAWIDALRTAAQPGPDGQMLTETLRLKLIRAWDRLRQGSEAQFLSAVGLLAPQPCPNDPDAPGRAACPGGPRCSHDWSREELGAALHLAPVTISNLLTDTRELTGRSAALLHAVHEGRLPAYAARKIAYHLTTITEDSTVALILARVMTRVGKTTPGQLERLTALTIESLRDPAEALAAHQRAQRAHTGITPGLPQQDGMGSATLTASTAEIAELLTWARTIHRNNRAEGDTRTVGQRRIHALLDALTAHTPTPTTTPTPTDDRNHQTDTGQADAGETSQPEPDAGETGQPEPDVGDADNADETADTASATVPARRPPISLRLIMTADTLLGRTNDPAHLTGIGAIPAYLARQLAITPTALQHALADHTGQLLDLGREHRFARLDLQRHIKARNPTCTWPGCTRPSQDCDLDHITPWNLGGPTNRANLHPLCKRHHRARDAGWTPHRHPDNTTTWTSPTGTSYTTLPPDPPGTQPPPPQPPRPTGPTGQERPPGAPPGQPGAPPGQPGAPPGQPERDIPDHDPLTPGQWQPPPPPPRPQPEEPPF